MGIRDDTLMDDMMRAWQAADRRAMLAIQTAVGQDEEQEGFVGERPGRMKVETGIETGRYPFGAEYPFGITIAGADVTVHEQIVYRGGVPLKLAGTTVTITTDYDWVVLKLTPATAEGEDTLTVVRYAADVAGMPPADDKVNGWLLRGLHRFRFAAGVATWDKAGWMPSDAGLMGY